MLVGAANNNSYLILQMLSIAFQLLAFTYRQESLAAIAQQNIRETNINIDNMKVTS